MGIALAMILVAVVLARPSASIWRSRALIAGGSFDRTICSAQESARGMIQGARAAARPNAHDLRLGARIADGKIQSYLQAQLAHVWDTIRVALQVTSSVVMSLLQKALIASGALRLLSQAPWR